MSLRCHWHKLSLPSSLSPKVVNSKVTQHQYVLQSHSLQPDTCIEHLGKMRQNSVVSSVSTLSQHTTATLSNQGHAWPVKYLGVSYLVPWCFEPSHPQRITSGLDTNFTLSPTSPSYSFHKSSYHRSCFFFKPIYILRALNMGTCIRQGDPFYSAGKNRNHVLATANTREIGMLLKNRVVWSVHIIYNIISTSAC